MDIVATDEMVSIREAAKRTGLSRTKITRMVDRGELASFDMPADERVRLVRLADVEASKRPVPRVSSAGEFDDAPVAQEG